MMAEATARAIQERVARIQDTLHVLHDLTLSSFSTTARNPAATVEWLDAAFTADGMHLTDVDAGLEGDAEALHRLYCLRGISGVLPGLHTRLPGRANMHYRDARGFGLAYPKADVYGEPSDLGSGREIRWTPPHMRGGVLAVTSSLGLYQADERIGVWSFEVPVAALLEDLAQARNLVARDIPELGWSLVVLVPEEGATDELARSFTEALDHVRQGDLDHRMQPIGDDLQGIVDAYNDMVGELQNTRLVNEQALRELEHSRQTTRAVFDGAPMGLVLLRPDRCIVDANAEFGRLLGVPPSSVLGRDLASIAAEEIGPRLATELDAPQSRAGERPVDTELRKGDESLVPVRIILRELELDETPFLLAGVEDLTLRRTLQARLQHTQQIQAIGKLAAGVAHDFNNLLTSVVGNACFLQESLDDADLREMAEAILVAARTGSALTAQLLAISRREIVQPRAVSFPEILRESETLLGRLLDEDVVLAFEIDDTLSAVWADPSQLLQVVMNLVINARDALGPEGRSIRVCLQRSPDTPESLRLSVSDDGVGIADGLRERVFEAFYTTKSRGTGLGLSTVRDIVEELGGRVSFQSEIGRGTTFMVEIPFLESAVPTEVEPTPSAPLPDDRIVLVVDDEAPVRDITVRMLERAGYVAQGCEGGEDALRALDSLGPQVGLVLTDVVMPGMSGRELADAILTRHPETPVLFMSGYTEDAVVRRGVEASKVGLLRKPFRPRALVEAVRRMMASSFTPPA